MSIVLYTKVGKAFFLNSLLLYIQLCSGSCLGEHTRMLFLNLVWYNIYIERVKWVGNITEILFTLVNLVLNCHLWLCKAKGNWSKSKVFAWPNELKVHILDMLWSFKGFLNFLYDKVSDEVFRFQLCPKMAPARAQLLRYIWVFCTAFLGIYPWLRFF